MAIKCPKCGARMIYLKGIQSWYCLNDGTEIEGPDVIDVIRADDPALDPWRVYL